MENNYLQDNVILAPELKTEEGQAKRMESLERHIVLLQKLFEKPENIQGLVFAVSTTKKIACGLFGSSFEITEAIDEILEKAEHLLNKLNK